MKRETINDFPELLAEWDYEKNIPLSLFFRKGSDAKVWWICKKGHSIQQKIANRCNGAGSPECYKERRRKKQHDINTHDDIMVMAI